MGQIFGTRLLLVRGTQNRGRKTDRIGSIALKCIERDGCAARQDPLVGAGTSGAVKQGMPQADDELITELNSQLGLVTIWCVKDCLIFCVDAEVSL